MTTQKCEYCLSNFRALKPHLTRCKAKIEFDKNQIIKINTEKKFDENYKLYNSKLDRLPNDMLFIIKSFLIYNPNNNNKDEYCSYRKLYKEYINYCIVSKKIYNIFYPSFDNILIYKNNLKEERETRICKSTAKTHYKLKDDELEYDLHYYLVRNPHYSSSPPMKVYQIADILDYMCKKYGTKQKHNEELELKESKKEESREKREKARDNRIINFDKLMKSYNYFKTDIIYKKFYDDYIDKGSPGLKKIEEEIKTYIKIKKREMEINKLFQENIYLKKYINHDIVKKYIIDYNEQINDVLIKIQEINNRELQIKSEFIKNDLYYDQQKHHYIHRNIINNFVENNEGTINDIIFLIKGKEIRRSNILIEFSRNMLNYHEEMKRHDVEKIIKNYIDSNIGDLNNIVNNIVEKRDRKNNLKQLFLENNIPYNENLRLCKDYIENGQSDCYDIVYKIAKKNFLFKNANYRQEFLKIRVKNMDFTYEAVHILVTDITLKKWCKLNKSCKNINVPKILYDEIKNICDNVDLSEVDITPNIEYYNNPNNIKCKCQQAGTVWCGMCKGCCNDSFCIKHSKIYL